MDDPYAILNLEPDASAEESRAAYRREARRYHPDVNDAPWAASRMKRINAAYEELCRLEELRRRQDAARRPRSRRRGEKPPRCRHDYETTLSMAVNSHNTAWWIQSRCRLCGQERDIMDDHSGVGYRVKWRAPGETAWRQRRFHTSRVKPKPPPEPPPPTPTPAWQEFKASCAATGMAIGGVLGFLFLLACIASISSGDFGGLGLAAFSIVALPGIGYWLGERVGNLLTIPARRQEERRSQ